MAKRPTRKDNSPWSTFKGIAYLTKPLNTLSRTFISAESLCRVFDVDPKEDIDSRLLRFKELNEENLKYLEISIDISADPSKKGIFLETSKYAGAIPIKSPKNGKYTVDLLVKGSYSPLVPADDMTRLLAEMEQTMLPDFHDYLRLCGESVKPPIYFECQNFINLYIKAEKEHWTKFANEIRIETIPRSSTNWSKYATQSYNPNTALIYENRVNLQTTDHKEWRQLVYVLDFCIQILSSRKTPQRTRRLYADRIYRLKKTYNFYQIEKTSYIPTHASDPLIIKALKKVANIILKDASAEKRSWKIDVQVLFERYVQYVFKKATKLSSWRVKANPHYSVHGRKPSWSVSFLEPDIILQSSEKQIVIDAKYKSHMLGITDKNGEKRRESFRSDLHQVLAYSAFNRLETKYVILTYPFTFEQSKETSNDNKRYTSVIMQRITSPFSSSNVKVILLGIPFTNYYLKEVINEVSVLIKKITDSNKV